jgi:hypothetical protein
MDLWGYIAAVETALAESDIVRDVEIVDERILFDRGYFRARLILSNGDFLEIAESFTYQAEQLSTLDYRYQWMDGAKQILRKRWDSVKHFPGLANFPHHVHILTEGNVEPGVCRNILEFLELMRSELAE